MALIVGVTGEEDCEAARSAGYVAIYTTDIALSEPWPPAVSACSIPLYATPQGCAGGREAYLHNHGKSELRLWP